MPHPLAAPLAFTPVYQTVVWGGRRMAQWRTDLPAGPIGESWDLADHERGMSVVAGGPLAGRTLRDLTAEFPRELVSADFSGGAFPLMIKLIDANDRLSVQVHPDDQLARAMGVGERGKTECWLMLGDGGEVFVGTRPGCDRARFEAALAAGHVADELGRHRAQDGDFFFLPARTVHALGAGCLLYEVQQTCDVTFRVDDWGRVGLDGKPRPLHIPQSLATIDFAAAGTWPAATRETAHHDGGSVRPLGECAYFAVEERRAGTTRGGGGDACSVVVCLDGHGTLTTAGGSVDLAPMRTCLVPAIAGAWTATAAHLESLRLLVAVPGEGPEVRKSGSPEVS